MYDLDRGGFRISLKEYKERAESENDGSINIYRSSYKSSSWYHLQFLQVLMLESSLTTHLHVGPTT